MTKLNSTIKISVIIPIYNVEDYIFECLSSVINQSLKDIEIIVINDGSTDKTGEIVNEIAKADDRIIVINQENHGQGYSRNIGIDAAKGEYIFFVDGDDCIEDDAFDILYQKMQETNANVIHFNYQELRNSKQTPYILHNEFEINLINKKYYDWEDFMTFCHQGPMLAAWNRIYKASLIKENKIYFSLNKRSEDHIFSFASVLYSGKVHYLDRVLYNYRITEGSASRGISDNAFSIFDNIKSIESFLIERNLFYKFKPFWSEYKYKSINSHIKTLPEKLYAEYIIKAEHFLDDQQYAYFLKENESY